jgi:hypothetical protein
MDTVSAFSVSDRGGRFRGPTSENQCYRDYFYGKTSELEHALGGMEGSAAFLHAAVHRPSLRHLSRRHTI